MKLDIKMSLSYLSGSKSTFPFLWKHKWIDGWRNTAEALHKIEDFISRQWEYILRYSFWAEGEDDVTKIFEEQEHKI